MANGIDPRIALAAQAPDLSSTISNILLNIQRGQGIARETAESPIRSQLLNLELEREQAQQPVALQQAQEAQDPIAQLNRRDRSRLVSTVQAAQLISPLLESGDIKGVKRALTERKARLVKLGIDTAETDEAIELADKDPELLKTRINQALNIGERSGIVKPLARAPGTGIQSSQFIPGVGFATLTRGGEAGLVPVAGVGETAEVKREQDIQAAARKEQEKATIQGKSAAVKLAVKKGGAAFDRIQPLNTAILNYDEAIAAIDAGAETGVIASFLPSFKKASIELDNVVKRLGLDVVGSTTFGALSEGELAFALSAAIPKTLQPQELKEWLIAKRDAQKKVKERVEAAASFLSDGTHTLKDWIEFDQAKQLNIKNQEQTQSAVNVIRFDAQGNIIQ